MSSCRIDHPLYLLQECNKEAKRLQVEVENDTRENHIPYFEMHAILVNREYVDAAITQLVRNY